MGLRAREGEFGDRTVAWEDCGGRPGELLVKDVIADNFLQQVLTRPAEYDVVATTNLNGDYISDALAAQVGGSASPRAATSTMRPGHVVFEATHGTAPVRGPGQGEPRLRHPLRGNDAGLHGLGGGRAGSRRPSRDHAPGSSPTTSRVSWKGPPR